MQVLYSRCAGFDVHKDSVMVCLLIDRVQPIVQQFGTTTAEYDTLKGEVEREEALVADIGDRLNRSRYDLLAKPRVTIYQEAAVRPQEIKKQVMGTVVGWGASFFAVCMVIVLAPRARSPER